MDSRRSRFLVLFLALLLVACQTDLHTSDSPVTHLGTADTVPLSDAASITTSSLSTGGTQGYLEIVSPLESTQLSGGGDLRVILQLSDANGQSIEDGYVRLEMLLPSGDIFLEGACHPNARGLYLCPSVTLPLRGSGGTWRILATARGQDGLRAEVEGAFQASPSVSERYFNKYGFWLEQPQIYGLGTGFYNLASSGGLHFEDALYEDGSGYVILENYLYETIGLTFTVIELHWHVADFPSDENGVLQFIERIALPGLHNQDPEVPLNIQTSSLFEFQGRPAWLVEGSGSEDYVAAPAAGYPIEWLVFTCPDSELLWSIVLHSDNESHMSYLRSLREQFICSEQK